jgi:hypothetical protein
MTPPPDDTQFSVYQFFANGDSEQVVDHVDAKAAVETAHSLTTSVGGRIGTTDEVIITDDEDHTCFYWKFGEGVLYPPPPSEEAPSTMIDPDAAIHEIGSKDSFSIELAREAAIGFCQAIAAFPAIEHMLCVAGYDDDTRELWDIPEAREFIRNFAGFVALARPGVPLEAWKLDRESLVLILVCTGLGRIKGRDPDTGAWLVEAGRP